MPVPTFAQLITLSSTANGLQAEGTQERLLTVAAMLASGTGPDGTPLPGGGGGLPAGGSVGQTVLNTAPGTGTWQDVINALVAGSAHVVLAPSGHQASIDLSAADKSLLAALGNHGVRAFNSATQSLATGTPTAVLFDTNIYDTDGFHSTSTNTDRLTIPAGLGGYYLVHISLNFTTLLGSGDLTVQLNKNGAIIDRLFQGIGTAGHQQGCGGATVLSLGAGDYVSLVMTENSGAGFTLGSAANDAPFFGAHLLGQVGGSGGSGLTPTAVKTAAYTAVAGDLVLCNTTGGTFAVTTPAAPVNGQIFAVKWYQGATAPTVTGNVDGSAGGDTLPSLNSVTTYQYDAVLTTWLRY